jgi:hypothetical protein
MSSLDFGNLQFTKAYSGSSEVVKVYLGGNVIFDIASLYRSNVEAEGGTVSERQIQILDDLLYKEYDDGLGGTGRVSTDVLKDLNYFWYPLSDNFSGALVCLKGSNTNVGFVSGDYHPAYGFVGDGTSYLTTSVELQDLDANNCTALASCSSVVEGGNIEVILGALSGSSFLDLYVQPTQNIFGRIGLNTTGAAAPRSSSEGVYVIDRSSSTDFKLLEGASELSSNTSLSDVTFDGITTPIDIFARNNAFISSMVCRGAAIGALSTRQINILVNALNDADSARELIPIGGAFICTVDTQFTTVGGTASDQMGLYFDGAFDVTIFWGDGSVSSHSGASSRVDHTYPFSGEYTLQVMDNSGSGFDIVISNDDTRDRSKYIAIQQLGDINIKNEAFRACVNLVSVSGAPRSIPVNISQVFQDCASLVSVDFSEWDFSGVNSVVQLFAGCSSLNPSTPQILPNLAATTYNAVWGDGASLASLNYYPENTSAPTVLANLARGLNEDITNANWLHWLVSLDLSSVTDMDNLVGSTGTIPTNYYDQLLVACDNGGQSNVTLGVGLSKYSEAAFNARRYLINKGWTITDVFSG